MTESVECDPAEDARLYPERTRLLLDTMLGKLATYCRMCGYDAVYAPDRGVEADDAVARLTLTEDRVLVTRDVALAERVPRALCLTARDIVDQLNELAAAGAHLELTVSRCSRCNGSLDPVDGDTTTPSYAPDPSMRPVWHCIDCGQYFWRGSHWDDVAATLSTLREETT